VLATALAGNYYAWGSSRAISPPVDLPAVTAGEELQLRMWHWFNYSDYDSGTVQISVLNSTNGVWGGWNDLASFSGYSQVWSGRHIDLGAYAGQRVRLAFYHYATRQCSGCAANEADGWYIDEVRIWKGVPQFRNPEGFELGQGDWSVEHGTWEFGTNGNRPVLATALAGNYYAWGSSRAISPPVDLPAVTAGEELQLRMWHWFNYSDYDSGTVQISVRNPTNGVWGGWNDLASFGGYSQVWSERHIDLGAYAGQRVRLAFYHYATRQCGGCPANEADGWYIDEVRIWKGVPQFRNPEGFELGQGDWSVEHGTWEFGANGNSHSGKISLTTALAGNYYAWGSSRAISPPVTLPNVALNETLTLCYRESYSYSTYDSGTLQVSLYDPTNRQWGTWMDLREVTGNSGGWSSICTQDLSLYRGQRVRFGFYHYATRQCGGCAANEADGWSIDDILIKRGSIAMAAVAAQTNSESSTLSFPVSVIGATPDSCVSYQLIDPPPGATIDPTTGQFSWTPEECQGPGVYNIPIYVVDFCNNEANDLGFVKVTVNEVNQAPWLLPAQETAYVGQTNFIALCSGDPDCPRNPFSYSLLAPIPPGASIEAGTGIVRWAPTLAQIGTHNLRVRFCDGGSPNYCVTNSLVIGITTNAFALDIQDISAGAIQFTIHGGSMAVDYVLDQASEICGCPCQTAWEEAERVSPTVMPYVFQRPKDEPRRFFRLRETPRIH
jgi:hypothetical protein